LDEIQSQRVMNRRPRKEPTRIKAEAIPHALQGTNHYSSSIPLTPLDVPAGQLCLLILILFSVREGLGKYNWESWAELKKTKKQN